jgi:Family of unknown function (DUF6221)
MALAAPSGSGKRYGQRMSSDLAAFLAARLDEDEAMIRRNADHRGLADGFPDYRTYDGPDQEAADEYIEHFGPGRTLREFEAKQVIMRWHYRGLPPEGAPEGLEICAGEEGDGDTWQMATPWPCPQIRALAAVYSDHPDYRAEWKPPSP